MARWGRVLSRAGSAFVVVEWRAAPRRVDEEEDCVVERRLVQVGRVPGGILALLPPEADDVTYKRRVAHSKEAAVDHVRMTLRARDHKMAVIWDLIE